MLFAFDKSMRRADKDGRLHVESSPLSKAIVNPYMGEEIPDFEKLGLDPKKKYMLLRHPDELEKAVHSFNNLPILSRHVPSTADAHPTDLVVGSTGTDAKWDKPYLTNSLVFWPRAAIDDVEEGHKKQLSAAYRYTADMTPGEYEGHKYDGVMRDIVGNHVAIVNQGRAGADVHVQDEMPESFRWKGAADAWNGTTRMNSIWKGASDAWSEAAREAALEARRSHAKAVNASHHATLIQRGYKHADNTDGWSNYGHPNGGWISTHKSGQWAGENTKKQYAEGHGSSSLKKHVEP